MDRSGVAALLALIACASVAGDAAARPQIKHHPDWEKHPATIYAAMTAAECTAELGRRGIAFTRVERAPGVLAPVRLAKDVGGVIYRTEAAPHLRDASPYDVFDCRLVLALHDFSKVLRAHDVEEVVLFSAWRPPAKAWPEGKLATRHPGALAIDAARFGKKRAAGEKERVWLDVKRDFRARIGAPVCGAGAPAPQPATPEGRELRSIVCEAADQHVFSAILTPHYDRAHHNHLHLELTPGVRWYLVR